MSTIVTRIAAGLIVAAGLAVGSAAVAPVALAETATSSGHAGSDSRPDRSEKPKPTPHRPQIRNEHKRGPVGLNGNRQSFGKPDQFQYFPKTLDQFKHLPFNPAMPGGD